MKDSKSLLIAAVLALALPLSSHATQINTPQNSISPSTLPESELLPDDLPVMSSLPLSLTELNLSKTQQETILSLLSTQIPQVQEYKRQRSLLTAELRQLTMAETFDEVKIKLLADKIASLEKEMIFNFAKIDNQILATLTQEQRKQLLEKILISPKDLQENKSNYRLHQKTKQTT
jgi:periplasmic protein CpxP/Spy